MLAAAAGVVVPLLLGDVVDIVLDGDGTRLGPAGGAAGRGRARVGVLTAVSRRYSDQLGMTMAADLREQVIDKALRMDSATLERAGTGDVTSRVTEDVELVNTSVRVAAGVFTSLVTVVLTFVGFATLDWRLALAFLLVFPVHAFGLRRFLPAAGPLYAKERVAAGAAYPAGDERPARSADRARVRDGGPADGRRRAGLAAGGRRGPDRDPGVLPVRLDHEHRRGRRAGVGADHRASSWSAPTRSASAT